MTEPLPIVYRDEHYVAIDKPAGLLVHRTNIDFYETRFAVQMLRDQLDMKVYNVHRLDKPTSGILVFGLSPEAARRLTEQFGEQTVQKEYLAAVRGWVNKEGTIDYDLKKDLKGERQPAITAYRPLARGELPIPVGRYPTARYSLLSVRPKTGRMHQIRRHLTHVNHPIIGDRKHGDKQHNHMVRETFGLERMMLHAMGMTFTHPFTGEAVALAAAVPEEFIDFAKIFVPDLKELLRGNQ